MARANTASLDTNFNIDPYYDDFDETDNFHRILYRPGFAVQARELTQMQTILQNQIDRFSEHIFKEGSVVAGVEVNYDPNYTFVKVRDGDASGSTITVSDGVGKYITGQTSNVTAIIIDSIDGSEAEDPNFKTLYVKYIDTGTQGTAGNTYFTLGERLVANSGSFSANVISTGVATGSGSHIKLDEGIIFAKDHFIRVPSANILLGRYSSNVSYKVGYNISEDIITSAGDTTLLDPSQGSFNYTAPGANRLKLTPTITKYELTANTGSNFVEIYRVDQGQNSVKLDKTQYSTIRDYLAKRTSDINGDFIVKGLGVRLREHLNQANNQGVYTAGQSGDSTKLVVDVDPGKAFIAGYDIENLVTSHVPTDKSLDFESIEATNVSANYGNYVNVKEVAGMWNVNGHNQVKLFNTFSRAVSNSQYSLAPNAGAQIGAARARAVEYTSGTKGSSEAKYKLYLYDINMTANTFAQVKSISIDNSSRSQANGIADVVVSTSNTAVLQEPDFNRAIFSVPATAIRRLRDTNGNIDTNFQFVKSFNVTIATDGTFSLATGAVDETYPFSTGALNTSQKQSGFYVVLNANTASASAVDTGSMSGLANTVTGLTSADTKFNIGDRIQFAGYANNFTVSAVTSSTLSTLEPALAAISSAGIVKKFNEGQVIDMSGVGGDGTDRTVTVATSTSANFDIQETLTSTATATVITELTKVDGQEIAKNYNSGRYVQVTVNQSDGSANTTGPWNLGFSDLHKITEVRRKTGNSVFTTSSEGSDVTSSFTLDTGQTDNLYNHGKLKLKSSATLTPSAGDVYLVKLNYFSHDTSQGVGYFSVDSYPIDDNNTANTTAITTQEIPIHISPVNGTNYDLRDSIDIRPRITDTSTDTTSVGSASVNPATSTAITSPAGGLRFMAPNENLTADLDYYLSRADVVSISPAGAFKVTKGKPSLLPVFPEEPSGHLPIAKVFVPPYPSISPEVGRQYSRSDLAAYIEPIRVEGYTMKEIGDLRDRLDKVEYFTRLSLAEQEAKNLNFADANGIDRFKNGIIVDTFTGHNIGDVSNEDYKAAIDRNKGELRPLFRSHNIDLDFTSANSSNIIIKPRDAVVTVGGTATFTVGETVTAGAASGKLVYQVDRKLYLEDVSGTFTVSATATGGTSSSSGTISAVTIPSDGKYATIQYSHNKVIEQPYASTTRNAAGLFWSFLGEITLSPDNDFWVDTTTAADVQINFDGNFDNWPGLDNSWQTEWNNWETTWTGSSTSTQSSTSTSTQVRQLRETAGLPALFTVRDTFRNTSSATVRTTTERQSRTGIRTGIVPQTQTERIGPRVVDTNIIPFMRSRVINVTGRGFKPNTRLYSFFDDTDVTTYITPTSSAFANTANEGTALYSDADGDVYAQFRIPADNGLRFRVGDRIFRLTDNQTNASGRGLVTTSGEATFTARGLTQTVQDTIISTRLPTVVQESVSDSRTLTSSRTISSSSSSTLIDRDLISVQPLWRNVDPIAQTFSVSDFTSNKVSPGAFLTKIDLYFATKDAARPVFVELREVDPSTSYITNKVIPFGKVTLEASEINTSTDGSKPTPVTFSTPVFLQRDREYAIIIKPAASNPNTSLFVARLGDNDISSSQRIVQQPNVGTLFASSNDRSWNAIPEEDLKFNVYVANFNTALTGTTIFKNEDREFFKITGSNTFNIIGEQIDSETTLTLSNGISVNANMVLVGNTSGANAIVSSNNSGTTSIRVKDVSTSAKFQDGERINVVINSVKQAVDFGVISSQATPTGKVIYYDTINEAGNTILHIEDASGTFVVGQQLKGQTNGYTTTIDSIDKLEVDTLHVNAGYISFEKTGVTPTVRMATSGTARDSVFRRIMENENNNFKASRYVLSRTLESSGISGAKSAELSFNLTTDDSRVSPAIDIERVNAIIVDNKINNDTTGETNASGGNAEARYITRILPLAEGQDAEDIKVKLNAYKPSTTDVKVYYKILNGEDSDNFDDRNWVQMNQKTLSTVYSDSENEEDFKIFDFEIPAAQLTGATGEVQYTNSQGITFTGFKYMSIKVVLTSSSDSVVPRVKDLMAIALQI